MSTESNPYSQGGGGTGFELSVQTAYFISFLLGGQVPGLPDSRITYFRQQAGSLGRETDDFLLHCEDEHTHRRALFQVKHQITITADNDTFKEVLTAAWKDFSDAASFNQSSDKIYLVTGALPMNVKSHLLAVLSWAKAKTTVADFLNEVQRVAAKNKYYDIFKTIIATTTPAVTDEELFRFCKCYEVLDYDLDDQARSVTKAAVLTCLSLAKDSEDTANSIWNEVYTLLSDNNPKGGEYTLETRPKSIMEKLKRGYLSDMQKTLLRLSTRSQALLEVITDKIGSFHLVRTALAEDATTKISTSQVLVVSGEAGAGKSALAKTLVNQLQEQGTGYVLAFKADELLTGQLRDWFDHQNINQDIKEIFSHFALLPNAVIYVDSMERLLEGEALPFKQLLIALQCNPSIKLIGSCRKSLLNVISFKFFTRTSFAEQPIPYLSDQDLDTICLQVPALKPAVDNKELSQLVRIPKYLDFAYGAIQIAGGDYSNISETEFQETLWCAIVKNILDKAHHGLPERRSESFIDIAVVRSRKMQAYVGPTKPDQEALEALKNETVLLQYQQRPLYAPAHDVLEDWALTRYTDTLFATGGGGPAFFTALGTEPAMRRAYRLWVAYALKEQDAKKIAFFTRNLTDTTLDHFWHIESLIAVLSSPHCEAFLQSNIALLKANDWALLFQIIQIMRTASKESGMYLYEKVLVPTGNGWAAIFKIMAADSASIPAKYHPVMLSTLQEWKLAVYTRPTLPDGTREAGLLTQFLLSLFLSEPGRLRRKDDDLEAYVQLLFAFAGGIPKELKAEIDRAPELADKDYTGDDSDRLIHYGQAIMDQVLKGPETYQLARYLPDLVMDLARQHWYRKPRPQRTDEREEFIIQAHERSDLDRSFRFGLASDRPIDGTESAYSTPVYWLLKYHTDKALDFVIALLNHATAHYKINAHEEDPVVDVALTLPDDSTNTQTGSFSLWGMFRGHTGYGNPLLKSVLMALEKYLLEVGEADQADGELFQHLLSILMTQSNTVAITAVVASAVMAYPHLAGEWILPLLDQKAFYSWDISRFQNDYGNLFLFQDGSLDVKERTQSHQLPHRKKYVPGLRGFVIAYCITIGTCNKQIAEMIDRLTAAADPGDLDWKKTLEDIDARRLVLGKQVDVQGKPGFEVQTEYSPEVQEMIEKQAAETTKQHEQMVQANHLRQVFEGKGTLTLADWTRIYDEYKELKELTLLRHAPGLLASIGVRDFWAELSQEQKVYCYKVIQDLATSFVLAGLTNHQLGFMHVNIYDTAPVMEMLVRILEIPEVWEDAEKRSTIEETIFFAQVAYFEDNNTDYKKFIKVLHQYYWPTHRELALNMWYGSLALGLQDGGLPSPRGFEKDADYLKAIDTFIADFFKKVRAGEVVVDFKTIDFGKYFPWSLVRAIKLIPDLEPPAVTRQFLSIAVVTYLRQNLSEKRRHQDDYHEIKSPLQTKLARIFLFSAQGVGAQLMDFFCKLLFWETVVDAMKKRKDHSLFFFFHDTVKQVILEADQSITKDANNNQRIATLFQTAWKTLDKITTELDRMAYWSLLLLHINWDEGTRHWIPIEGLQPLLLKYVKEGTALLPGSAINLLATVGDQTMLPEALLVLVSELQRLAKVQPLILYKQTRAEVLVRNLYEYHLEKIREDPTLMAAYRWLLDKLIDEGSTDAYWIDEFVISYHRKPLE